MWVKALSLIIPFGQQSAVFWLDLDPDLLASPERPQFGYADGVEYGLVFQFNEIANLAAHVASVYNCAAETIHVRLLFIFSPWRNLIILRSNHQFHTVPVTPVTGVMNQNFVAIPDFDPEILTFPPDDHAIEKI